MHLLCDRPAAPPPEPADWMTPADLLALLAPREPAPAAGRGRDLATGVRTTDATGRPSSLNTRTAPAEE